METVKRSVVMGEQGIGRQNKKDFYVSETILHDTIIVDAYYCTFIQIHRIWIIGNNEISTWIHQL